jgi:hypothetical protein
MESQDFQAAVTEAVVDNQGADNTTPTFRSKPSHRRAQISPRRAPVVIATRTSTPNPGP